VSRPAVFLDRDGTLVEEVPYLHDPARVALLPGTGAALSRLAQAGFALVVVTNQAGVARGLYGEEAVQRVHLRLRELLAAAGVVLDGARYCPHHPQGRVPAYTRACRCRKPAPGMLEAAARDLDLDLAASYLVGNDAVDVGAARAAGATPLFVTTGQAAGQPPPDSVAAFPSLPAAVDALLTVPEIGPQQRGDAVRQPERPGPPSAVTRQAWP
jgi:D-glycero-D-manno-heptose 1,7-bisphosphate phosphatase